MVVEVAATAKNMRVGGFTHRQHITHRAAGLFLLRHERNSLMTKKSNQSHIPTRSFWDWLTGGNGGGGGGNR